MFHYYYSFAKLFRACHHDYCQEVYEACFKPTDRRKDKTLNVEECRMAPIICDFFLRFYVPHENKNPDFQSVMELLSCDFCHWMYANKLTIVEVSMNKAYQITRRNLIEPKSTDHPQDKEDKDESEDHNSSANESEAENKLDNRSDIKSPEHPKP